MASSFQLLIKETRESLHVVSAKVEVHVIQFLAETQFLLHFKNNSKKANVEAELLFTLEDGSSICGFATDIYGQMVDGVVTSKETAQVALENAVSDNLNP